MKRLLTFALFALIVAFATPAAFASRSTGVAVTTAQNPNPVSVGSSATYGITVTYSGQQTSCTTTLGTTGLPAGATAVFSPTTTDNSGGTTDTTTLTVSVTNAVTIGSHGFTITTTDSAASGCTTIVNPTVAATVVVAAAKPTLTKSFSPTSITAGGTSTMTLVITNPNSATMTGAGVVDTFPTTPGAMKVAATPSPSNSCSADGGTWTTTANAASVTLSGVNIPANTSCTLTVAVTAPTSGTYANTTNAPTSTADGTGTAATANLTVVGTPTKLVYGVSPSTTAAGSSIAPAITVQVEDASNNIVTTSSASVAIAFGTNAGPGVLSGTTSVNAINGVATFSNLSINKAANGYTLAASSSGLTGVTSGTFNITAGTATQLVFTTPPSTPNNGGSAFGTQPVVSVEDANNNIVTTAGNSITLAIGTNPVGGTLTCGTNPLGASSGVASFTGCSINKAGVGYTLTASAAGLSTATTGSITIQVGPANKLVFGVSPSGAQAGSTITPAVTVLIQDAGGNQTTATNTVALGIATGTGVLTGGTGIAAINGTATFSALSINKTGVFTLQATSAGLTSITSGSFTITPGTATQLVWGTQPPASVVDGASITPAVTVQVEDANNNVVTSGTGSTASVAMAIGNNPAVTAVLSGTTPVNAIAGVATFSGLSINLIGNGYTLSATSAGLSTATSNSFNVTPGTATKLAFGVQPSSAVDTVAISPAITVQILDANGNLTTSTTSVTLAITTNPGGSTLTGGGATAAVAGTATFSGVSLNKIGNGYVLTATDGSLTAIASNPFNITIGTATKLVFGQQPTTTAAGSPIAPAVTVLIEDAGSNVTASTASVAIAFGTNTAGATLSGTLSQPGVSGTATFNDLSVNKTQTNFTLSATSAGLTSATSNAFTITAGIATQLVFTTQPGGGTGGTTWTTQPTVSVEDANNNVVTSGTNSTASITLAIGTNSGPGGTLTCTANPRSAVAGADAFAGCKIDVAGTAYTLTAAAAGLTGATSNPFNITVGAGTQLQFGVQPSDTVDTVAISPAVTVKILDAGGNQTTGTTAITMTILNNPGTGTLTGGGPINAVNGVATFPGLSINKIGTAYTIRAAGTGVGNVTSNAFNILLGAATQLTFSTEPASTNNHVTMPNVVVQIQDAGGNLVPTASAAVTVAIANNAGAGGAGVLSGTLTQSTTGGAATFNDLSIDLIGTGYTLGATSSPVFTPETSTAFNITAGPATQLVFTTEPSATAAPGTAFAIQPVVSVEDAHGNIMTTGTGSTASITLAIGINAGPGGVLTCTTNPKAAVAGADAFAGCKINLNGNGYTLTAASAGLTGATSTAINITLGATKQVGEQLAGSCTSATATCTIALNASALATSNNMLLVGISNASATAVSTVTWNGSALAIVPTCSATGTQTNSAHFEIWFLANPALVSANVVVTFGSAQTVEAGAAIFSNVSSLGTCVKTSGQSGSTSATLNPVVAAGGAAFDTFTENTIGTATITTPVAPQVSLWNISAGASAGSGSYELAPVASMTRSWNTATSVFAYGAVPLNPTVSHKTGGKVVIGSLLDQEKLNPSIFHLGDDARSTNSSISAPTNADQIINDSNNAIITKRDN